MMKARTDLPFFVMPPVTNLELAALGPNYWRGQCYNCKTITYAHEPTTEELYNGVPCASCGIVIDSFERLK